MSAKLILDGWNSRNLKPASQSLLAHKHRILSDDLKEDGILLDVRILDIDAAFGNSKGRQRRLPTCRAVGCTH